MLIQYLGFQPKPRGREYSYRVVDPRSDPRQFTLTISNQAFAERHVPYQDAAAICYQKLQSELATETADRPLRRHLTVSDQDLDAYREKYRPAKRRSS
jgi:hypothetical protein